MESLVGLGVGCPRLSVLEVNNGAKKAVDWSFLASLPTSLQRLGIKMVGYSPRITLDDIAMLPRRLRSLRLQGVDVDVRAVLPRLPRSLLSFVVPQNYADAKLFVPPLP